MSIVGLLWVLLVSVFSVFVYVFMVVGLSIRFLGG